MVGKLRRSHTQDLTCPFIGVGFFVGNIPQKEGMQETAEPITARPSRSPLLWRVKTIRFCYAGNCRTDSTYHHPRPSRRHGGLTYDIIVNGGNAILSRI